MNPAPRLSAPLDSATGDGSLPSRALRFIHRRPDLWPGLATLVIVVTVFWLTPLSILSIDRVVLGRLTDSFAAGLISVFVGVFVLLLLRAAPPSAARVLRISWIVAVTASTIGLLFAFAHPSRTSTSWILQSLVLSTLSWSILVATLLFASGLVRGRDFGNAAHEIGRHWLAVLLYLGCGGYLLTIIRIYTPEVFDPVLFKMDASLGFPFVETIARWNTANPVAKFLSHYTYPLLGLFAVAVGGSLHLQGATLALRRYLAALALIGFMGPICYWVIPAVGPIYAYSALFAAGPAPDGLRESILAGPSTIPFSASVLRNVMPSLHTAFTLVALAAVWPSRRQFLLWLPLGFTQIATTLTLGVHYVVDLVAAVPLAVLAWSLAEAGVRRFPPSGLAPRPPLRDGDRGILVLGGTLLLSLIALVGWGIAAPISPLLAWPLALAIVAAPSAAAIRLFSPASFRSAAPTLNAPTSPRAPSASRLLACAVFCTGGTALILEQVAEKYLSTLLGASRPAATIVLAVYFIGLALGATLCPKQPSGAGRRLALLELFVAAWCALVALGFFAVDRSLGHWLASHGSSAFALTAARTALAVLWLLPPTLAMGAQLPTLAALLRSSPVLAGVSLPRLYALNLAGACTFCFVAPALLFNLVGASGALWFAAALAAFVGLILWSGLPLSHSPTSVSGSSPSLSPSRPSNSSLATAFLAGVAFFALEVVWFHLISAVCGASAYSFSLLLGVILLGLALAGHLAARPKVPPLAHTFAALAVALALSNAAWPWTGRALATINSILQLEWFWAGELFKTLIVAVLVIPPAVFLGQVFPRLLRNTAADGAHVGRLSVANILGCVTGALLTGFVFIPYFGAERTLFTLDLLAAAAALIRYRSLPRRPIALAAAGVLLTLFLPRWDLLELTRGHGVYLGPGLPSDSRLIWFREDFTAGFVTVTARTDARGRTIKTLLQNGKFDANDGGEVPAQISFGFLAALHAPTTGRALVIGAGSGQTAATIAQLGFTHIDIAELSPAHLADDRAEFAHLHHGIFDRPGVAVHIRTDETSFSVHTRPMTSSRSSSPPCGSPVRRTSIRASSTPSPDRVSRPAAHSCNGFSSTTSLRVRSPRSWPPPAPSSRTSPSGPRAIRRASSPPPGRPSSTFPSGNAG